MHDSAELASGVVFLVFAILAGEMAHRLRSRAIALRMAHQESLRNALLSSVSHDLKSPLVSMLGAATSLRDLDTDLTARDRSELVDSIIAECQRLERYIENLLEMTRLGLGHTGPDKQWISPEELYHAVIRRLTNSGLSAGIPVHIEPNLPSVFVHTALIEQALFNGLENALKVSPDNEPPEVFLHVDAKTVCIDICDYGPGIPDEQWEPVFDQFSAFSHGDRYQKGTGLGLTIARGIMRVHGGDARIIPIGKPFAHCLRLSLPRQASDAGNAE